MKSSHPANPSLGRGERATSLISGDVVCCIHHRVECDVMRCDATWSASSPISSAPVAQTQASAYDLPLNVTFPGLTASFIRRVLRYDVGCRPAVHTDNPTHLRVLRRWIVHTRKYIIMYMHSTQARPSSPVFAKRDALRAIGLGIKRISFLLSCPLTCTYVFLSSPLRTCAPALACAPSPRDQCARPRGRSADLYPAGLIGSSPSLQIGQ